MLVTVEGIVIGRRTIGENNCFIDVLTDEYGVIEATAHGIRKLTSKNAGACGLFSYSRFCFAKTGVNYMLNSAEPKYSFYGISSDLEALSLAAYFAEVLKDTATAEQESKGLIRFMSVSLYEIEKRRLPLSQIKAVFELRLAAMLGFAPDLWACRECVCYESKEMYLDFSDSTIICGNCAKEKNGDFERLTPSVLYAMRFIVYSPLEKIYRFSLPSVQLAKLSEICEKYLLGQLERSFRSLDYYKSIVI